MMVSPPWLVRASNIGIVVSVVGVLFLSIQMINRLRTRVIVAPLPSLAQLADSLRWAAGGAAPVVAISPDAVSPRSATIGGPAPADSALRAGQRALARGRWHEAARAFDVALGDSASASAALGASLLAAWRADAPAAERSLARAQRQAARLSPAERQLLDAHQRWMAGDIPGSDSAFRVLLSAVPDDPTLWYAAAFVHRHDGGAIDSALVSRGSPMARNLRGTPSRRVSYGGAIAALWRVEQLAPYHEAARLELASIAALLGDRRLARWLAWGAELYPVEAATRFTMRALDADAKDDPAAWDVMMQLAALQPDPQVLFATARALATSAGIRTPLSVWHAAELLSPLTNAERFAPELVARAHAWRGQLYFVVQRPIAAREELVAAASIDPSLGLPLLAWTGWLALDADPDTLRADRSALEQWSTTTDSADPTRTPLHPHRGMERQLRAYGLGLLSAALFDTTSVTAWADSLDRLPAIPGDTALRDAMAAALRVEVALARNDVPAALLAGDAADRPIPPLWRDESPFRGRVHARYRRAVALQAAWENGDARAGFVSFFSPAVPELLVYRPAVDRFNRTP